MMEEQRTLSDKFMLRLPDGMRDQIKAAAEANGRSMNAEIVARLRSSFDAPAPDLRELARQIADEAVAQVRESMKEPRK